MPEGDYVKSDGDVLFASEFNDARGNADVNLFTDPVSNLKGIVSATGVNTLAFPRTKRNFIYELIADDVANTTTGLTHDDARDTYQGGVGSAVTYISQTLFASETINSATINYDAEKAAINGFEPFSRFGVIAIEVIDSFFEKQPTEV